MRKTATEVLDSLEELARVDGIARFVSGGTCVMARFVQTTGNMSWFVDGQPRHRQQAERAIDEARARPAHPFASRV